VFYKMQDDIDEAMSEIIHCKLIGSQQTNVFDVKIKDFFILLIHMMSM